MKSLIIVVILFCSSVCFSEVKGYIELGKDIDYNIAYTDIQIGYNFRFWNMLFMPYGGIQTWFEIENGKGSPFIDIYTVGTQLRFDCITFDFSHFCSHEVVTSNRSYIYDYAPPKDGEITKLSVRYDF
jgi:hypothetical protein